MGTFRISFSNARNDDQARSKKNAGSFFVIISGRATGKKIHTHFLYHRISKITRSRGAAVHVFCQI